MNVPPNRRNTLVCAFDMSSPRISAYEIHEWIHTSMRLNPEDVLMIQIDSTKRHVYLKLRDDNMTQHIIQMTAGQLKYKHPNGEVSNVKIEMAGTQTTRVRLANLPPEIGDNTVRNTLTQYGELKEIMHETWAATYRYPVANGIRILSMQIRKHIPSNLMIAGHRVLVTYEGQPTTCYGCGATDHLYIGCPNRNKPVGRDLLRQRRTWANIAANGSKGEGGETEPPNLGAHATNVQDAKPIDEDHPHNTQQHTQGKTDGKDNMATGVEHEKAPPETQNTRDTAEEQTTQPMDITQGIQPPETTQIPQTRQMPDSSSDEDYTPASGTVSETSRTQRQTKGRTDRQEPMLWADEIEDSTEMEDPLGPTHTKSPKRTKKLKIDRHETKPPDRGRSRSRNTGKRN